MNYKLAKQLKDAGFQQEKVGGYYLTDMGITPHSPNQLKDPDKAVYIPTLSELIEACGEGFVKLENEDALINEEDLKATGWYAMGFKRTDVGKEGLGYRHGTGSTPEIAVAKLYLKLNEPRES